MFEPQRGIGRLSCEVIRLNPYFSPKERLMFVRSSALAVATILAVTALSPTGAFAVRGAFDGSWSVQTATSRGACPSDVGFAVDVRDGVVSAAGLLTVSGNVGLRPGSAGRPGPRVGRDCPRRCGHRLSRDSPREWRGLSRRGGSSRQR